MAVILLDRDRRKEHEIANKAAIANKNKTVPIRIMNGYVYISPQQATDKHYMAILRKRYNLDKDNK